MKPFDRVQLVKIQSGWSRSRQAGSESCLPAGDRRKRSVASEKVDGEDSAPKSISLRLPRLLFSVEGCIGFTDMRGDPEPPESLAVAGEFLFMPRPVFRITHNNVTANDMIWDSRLWIRAFRSEFVPSAQHDFDTRCSSVRLRKAVGRPGQISPRVNKTHYVTPQQPENARKCPPDTRGMAFEKLILPTNYLWCHVWRPPLRDDQRERTSNVGECHEYRVELVRRSETEGARQTLIFPWNSKPGFSSSSPKPYSAWRWGPRNHGAGNAVRRTDIIKGDRLAQEPASSNAFAEGLVPFVSWFSASVHRPEPGTTSSMQSHSAKLGFPSQGRLAIIKRKELSAFQQ